MKMLCFFLRVDCLAVTAIPISAKPCSSVIIVRVTVFFCVHVDIATVVILLYNSVITEIY